MNRNPDFRRVRLFAAVLGACLLFCASLSLGIGGSAGSATAAHPVWLNAGLSAQGTSTGSTPAGIGSWRTEVTSFTSRSTGRDADPAMGHAGSASWLLIAASSIVLAFNLVIFGHLRRVHASPRRRSWGRG